MTDLDIEKIIDENKKLKEENKELKEELEKLHHTISLIQEAFNSGNVPKSINEVPIEPSDFEDTDDSNNEDNDDMSIISFLARSDKRVEILKSLSQGAKIPSVIGKDIGDSSHHVSKYLASLKEKGLVVCLNEEDKRYRFYSITSKGKRYLNIIEKKDY